MKRIFIDREKCLACLTCMVVCVDSYHNREEIADSRWTDIEIESRNYTKFADGYSMTIVCRHCSDPECVTTCMSGALKKSPVSGHITYEKERCGQCFMCVMCCPYGLPKPDIKSNTEVIRCNFCNDAARGPSCAASCPTGALTVMEVDE